jgi:PAS domain S-box-containing protein
VLRALLYTGHAARRRWTGAEVALLREVAERSWAAVGRAQAEAALAESEARFRSLADSAPVMVWTADPEGLCTWLSAGWYALTGQTEAAALGFGWTLAVHPEDRPAVVDAYLAATRDRRAFRMEYRVRAADGSYRWALDSATPRYGAGGLFLGFVGSVIDITDRRQMEEQHELLAREVEHRAKNALAVVLAALRLTRAETLDEYRRMLEGRIATLGRAQALIAGDRWQGGADLRRLIEGEMAAFLGAGEAAPGLRARLEGPAVALPTAATQPLAMALHELATNAVKHGALSTAGGSVAVTWREEQPAAVGGGRMLHLRWAEEGGPPVEAPPGRRGFGTRVLDGTVRAQLGGIVAMDWRRSGLVCDITVPLGRAPEPPVA